MTKGSILYWDLDLRTSLNDGDQCSKISMLQGACEIEIKTTPKILEKLGILTSTVFPTTIFLSLASLPYPAGLGYFTTWDHAIPMYRNPMQKAVIDNL